METLAFIAPMSIELRPFLRHVGDWKRSFVQSFPVYRFELFSRECRLIESGIGAQNASDATRAMLIGGAPPRYLVAFGVAGATASGLRVGDVVAVRSVRELEAGALGEVRQLAAWSPQAIDSAARALATVGARLLPGTAVTTPGSSSALPDNAGAVLEMETAAIARIAGELGVPLLSMRSISDSVDEPLPFDPGDVLKADGRVKVLTIAARALANPGFIRRLARLRRNTKAATRNLASALLAALEAQLDAEG